MAGISASSQVFLTEDITTNILLRLPTASCIFRFRCVCKSWGALLSDPEFIRRVIFFQSPADRQSLRILITGKEKVIRPRKIYYSLHSYETLCPIETGEDHHPLPSIPYYDPDGWSEFRMHIAGCCDGIFCISDVNHDGAGNAILLNPTTSEIKYLPLPPCPHHLSCLERYHKCMGFGFDPGTRDYKVVRALEFQTNCGPRYNDGDDYHDSEYYYNAPEFAYSNSTEVYSLRNDSWKRLSLVGEDTIFEGCRLEYVRQHHRDTSRNEKCYWIRPAAEQKYEIVSFDMSKEVFKTTTFAGPPTTNTCSGNTSVVMLKESFVTIFLTVKDKKVCPSEIWGLMKYGVAESWARLFTFSSAPCIIVFPELEVWKDGMYICSMQGYADESTSDLAGKIIDGVYVFDPIMSRIRNRLDVEGRTHRLQIHTYAPTRVSLSDLE